VSSDPSLCPSHLFFPLSSLTLSFTNSSSPLVSEIEPSSNTKLPIPKPPSTNSRSTRKPPSKPSRTNPLVRSMESRLSSNFRRLSFEKLSLNGPSRSRSRGRSRPPLPSASRISRRYSSKPSRSPSRLRRSMGGYWIPFGRLRWDRHSRLDRRR